MFGNVVREASVAGTLALVTDQGGPPVHRAFGRNRIHLPMYNGFRATTALVSKQPGTTECVSKEGPLPC